MAAPTTSAKQKKPAKPAKPRSFYLIYKGQFEGEPEITFDKDQAMDKLTSAMEAGDTQFRLKKLTLPKSSRPRNGAPQAGNGQSNGDNAPERAATAKAPNA